LATPITVLVPVYNAGKFLRPALDGILNQSWRDFELLIIDDASTDKSWETIFSYQDKRIRALKNERNLGIAATLNKGLELASGELIARYDPDDLSHQDRLKTQIETFEQNKDAIAVFSRARLIDEKNRLIGWVRTPTNIQAIRWDLCFQNTLLHGSVMFRKQFVWEKLGGYRLLRTCEDYDLWSRIIRNHGKIIVLKENLVDYRIHSHSMMGKEHSEGFSRSHDTMREIMKKNCQAFMPTLLSEQQMNILSSAWIDPTTANWIEFFTIQKNMLQLFQKADLRELRKTLIEEDFSLYRKCRQAGCAIQFLRALWQAAPTRFVALPWIRILGDKVLSTLHWRSPR
jgi:glycosyltransferase involved in cell wall biosynthesis